jgi:hypothetical protein
MFTPSKIPLAIFVTLTLLLAGCEDPPKVPTDIGQPDVELSGQLQQFFAVKEKQAHELAELDKKSSVGSDQLSIAPEVWPYFAAARKGDWQKVAQLYFSMSARSYQFSHPASDKDWASLVWQPVNETFRAYEQLCAADPKYTLAYGSEVLDSMPPGSMFFAGTDAGRFVTTFLAKSHASGDPVFIITPNALTDGLYSEYLRSMFGGKIHTPTIEESQAAFSNYMADATIRLQQNRLLPSEDIKLTSGKLEISGQVAVMQINALMARAMFDQTPDHEFFLDPNIPLAWAASNAIPHGFIFKLNRSPLEKLSVEMVQRNREFWAQQTKKIIGDWLSEKTSLQEICDFAERVYLRKDLSGFTGDSQFVQTVWPWRTVRPFLGAGATYAKSRSNQAMHYYWRATNASTSAEHGRMADEADFAFRQALAFCPYQTETFSKYVEFLCNEKKSPGEAIQVATLAQKFQTEDKTFQNWVSQMVDAMKANLTNPPAR